MKLQRIVGPLLLATIALACQGKPAKNAWDTDDRVPANSASSNQATAEARAADSEDEDEASPAADAPPPLEADSSTPARSTKEDSAPPSDKPGGKRGGKGNGKKASRKQCEEMIDKYVELLTAQLPQLAGVGKEVIESAKKQARAKKGDPCEGGITVAQHDCAMKAESKQAWESCVR